ncbi:hypothetical protein BS17DRAFT_769362 [Gyrodon lividus]|nr:hypothetical protein BS17DRAFT_769362 [Gyrodon lividus]
MKHEQKILNCLPTDSGEEGEDGNECPNNDSERATPIQNADGNLILPNCSGLKLPTQNDAIRQIVHEAYTRFRVPLVKYMQNSRAQVLGYCSKATLMALEDKQACKKNRTLPYVEVGEEEKEGEEQEQEQEQE